jgi:hypothetical protein
MQRVRKIHRRQRGSRRAGVGTLDYVLTLGALFTISGAAIYAGGKIIKLAYEMVNVLIAYPFM